MYEYIPISSPYSTPTYAGFQNSSEDSGTSLVAIKFKDGVVVASDSRISAGQIIPGRAGRKIGLVHHRVAVASSGKTADNQTLFQIMKAQLNQNSQEINSPGGTFQSQARIPANLPTVKTAAHIYKSLAFNYKNQLAASSIVAGWDQRKGPQIYAVPRGGLMIEREFAADGSGSVFMLPYLDEHYKSDFTKEMCIEMASTCLRMAIRRDASSGGIMDIVVITADDVQQIRIDSNSFNYDP